MFNSLQPHGLQHARLPCPSPTSRACSNSCPSSQCCHPTISSSVVPFSSCLQSFPASRSFPMSQGSKCFNFLNLYLQFFFSSCFPVTFSFFKPQNRTLWVWYLVLGSDKSCWNLCVLTYLPSVGYYGEETHDPKGSIWTFPNLAPHCCCPPPIFDVEESCIFQLKCCANRDLCSLQSTPAPTYYLSKAPSWEVLQLILKKMLIRTGRYFLSHRPLFVAGSNLEDHESCKL